MNTSARLVVVSCPRYAPIQELWKRCQQASWPDCPYPIDILSPELDVGWNANLLTYLETVTEALILLLLDDHFLAPATDGSYSENMNAVRRTMAEIPDIAMIKLQAGNAWPPEIEFKPWNRLREYDRAHHPFKRTNLVPTMFRRTWLQRLSHAVLNQCGPKSDKGRNGALEFEVAGTLLTEDAVAWPERMLGIHRPNPDGGGGRSLLNCMSSDGVREGKLKADVREAVDVSGIPGIEAFL